MKIVINKNTIEGIINLMEKVINQKTAIPILLNALIEVRGEDVTVTASDAAKTLIMRFKAVEPTEETRFCVNAMMLSKALHDMPAEPVTFEIAEEKLTVNYTDGFTSMPTFPVDDYPMPLIYEYKERLKLPGLWLTDAIKRTAWAAAKDETRQAMSGVNVAQKDGGIDLVATDGRALVRQHVLVADQPDDASASLIIPKDVADLLTHLPLDEDTEIEWTDSAAHIKMHDHDLYFSLCTEKYPNYAAIIPKETSSEVTVNRIELMNALRRVTPFINNSNSMAIIEANEGRLTIKGYDYERSTAASTTIDNLEQTTQAMKFGVSTTLLMAELKNTVALNVTIRTVDAAHPIIIEPSEDEELPTESTLMIAMPMRIEEE